jgi:aquaporin Z
MRGHYPIDVMIWSLARPISCMNRALREHWAEYVCEAMALGIFMISAGVFTALFEYPASPVHRAITDPFVRRIFVGTAMGLTAIGLIFSPLGSAPEHT